MLCLEFVLLLCFSIYLLRAIQAIGIKTNYLVAEENENQNIDQQNNCMELVVLFGRVIYLWSAGLMVLSSVSCGCLLGGYVRYTVNHSWTQWGTAVVFWLVCLLMHASLPLTVGYVLRLYVRMAELRLVAPSEWKEGCEMFLSCVFVHEEDLRQFELFVTSWFAEGSSFSSTGGFRTLGGGTSERRYVQLSAMETTV